RALFRVRYRICGSHAVSVFGSRIPSVERTPTPSRLLLGWRSIHPRPARSLGDYLNLEAYASSRLRAFNESATAANPAVYEQGWAASGLAIPGASAPVRRQSAGT